MPQWDLLFDGQLGYLEHVRLNRGSQIKALMGTCSGRFARQIWWYLQCFSYVGVSPQRPKRGSFWRHLSGYLFKWNANFVPKGTPKKGSILGATCVQMTNSKGDPFGDPSVAKCQKRNKIVPPPTTLKMSHNWNHLGKVYKQNFRKTYNEATKGCAKN